MGLPQSENEIGNMALDYLGQAPVQNFISTPTGALIGRHFAHIRQTLLREYVWNWSKKRTLINRSRTPAFDWKDAYVLPNDFIRFLSIDGDLEIEQRTAYDLEINPDTGKMEILVNASSTTTTVSTLKLRYVFDAVDPKLWDAKFRECFTLKLATYIGYQVTKNEGLVKLLDERLNEELPMAISVDGQENLPIRVENSRFIDARVRGSLGGTGVAGPWTDFKTTFD